MENRQLCPKCGGIGVVYHVEKITDGYRGEVDACPVCRGTGSVPVAITNGDRIRAMSDEELAIEMCQRSISTICDIVCQGGCKAIATLNKTGNEACREIIMKWLQQPAEEET